MTTSSKPPAHHAPLHLSSRLNQLTVGELRRIIADAPDYAPVLMECVAADHAALELVEAWGADYGGGVLEFYLPASCNDALVGEEDGNDTKEGKGR